MSDLRPLEKLTGPIASKHLTTALVAVAVVAVPVAMLHTLWANPTSAGEDDVIYYRPLRVMVGSQLRSGDWPISTSPAAGELPLMGDPQSATLHPATWGFAFMDADLAYSLSIFAAFSTMAAGGAIANQPTPTVCSPKRKSPSRSPSSAVAGAAIAGLCSSGPVGQAYWC